MRRLVPFAVFLALAARAQVHEQINVEVIDVPVYVTGSADLKREDFQLFVNGKPQTVDYFDVIDFAAAVPPPGAAAATTSARDIRDRRLFLLLFDISAGDPHLITRASRGALAMLQNALPADFFAVATHSALHGVELVVPFTADRDLVRRAIVALKPSEAHDPLELAITDPERTSLAGNLPDDRDPLPPDVAPLIDTQKEILRMPLLRIAEQEMDDLAALAPRLAPLEGYKRVLFLSRTFPVPLGDSELFRHYETMRRAFLAANVVVDSIDLTVNNPFDKGLHFGSEGLHGLARDTGGQHIHNENPPGKAFARIADSTRRGYRLGFNMPRNAKRGFNSIEVRVRNVPADTVVSYRRGFSRGAVKPSTADALLLADILMNDIPQTGVGPLLHIDDAKHLEVSVPPNALAEGGDVEVLLYIFDANGATVDFQQKRMKSAGIVRSRVDLPAGHYVAKALLRAGDSIGFSRLEFER